MAIKSLKASLINYLSNIPGWHTKRHLVSIESDDWGSIRMPSKKIFDILLKEGIDLLTGEGSRYNKYDSLETAADLTELFDVLSSIKDCTKRPAVLTPFSVVANPDFHKIKESDFSEYFYEPFTDTMERFPDCKDSYKYLKSGIENRLFVPQFHGREHLNVKVWMRALNEGHQKTILAFNNGMWGLSTANDPKIKLELQAAFDLIDAEDLIYHKEVLISGLNLFEEKFGYRANFFVPPNGALSSKLETTCIEGGIKYLSASRKEIEPIGHGKSRKRYHWLGQKSNAGILYINRNCFFEPNQLGRDWVDSCLNDISIAFRWRKPAVISTHRVNYIGALYKENRENGLRQLSMLLKQIMINWPDAEFVTSGELGDIISNE